jgi:hypothetical protein
MDEVAEYTPERPEGEPATAASTDGHAAAQWAAPPQGYMDPAYTQAGGSYPYPGYYYNPYAYAQQYAMPQQQWAPQQMPPGGAAHAGQQPGASPSMPEAGAAPQTARPQGAADSNKRLQLLAKSVSITVNPGPAQHPGGPGQPGGPATIVMPQPGPPMMQHVAYPPPPPTPSQQEAERQQEERALQRVSPGLPAKRSCSACLWTAFRSRTTLNNV